MIKKRYQLQYLTDFPHFLSPEEKGELEQWGLHAQALWNGTLSPSTETDTAFVAVARGLSPPVTRFQRVWLRYMQACNAQQRINAAECSSKELTAAITRIRDIEDEVSHYKKLWEASIITQGASEASTKTIAIEPLVSGSLKEINQIPTDAATYRAYVTQGFQEVSDNDIFKLYNEVDSFGLTPGELRAFNSEHTIRKIKYYAVSGSSDHGRIVYADTDGQ